MAKYDVTSIAPRDQLFVLIKSLSKSEKRNFKLYANRLQNQNETKFVQLFDVLDKSVEYDEEVVFKKIIGLSKSQLANLKRHLFKQILTSLRLQHIQKNLDIQIREQIDFSQLLYNKGLYLQSLKLLERIKGIAIDNNRDLLHLEIIEFQKLIEERHITRSRAIKNKVPDLIEEADARSKIINNTCKLSNLKIKIHGLYIQVGHVKTKKDSIFVKEFFKSNLDGIRLKDLTFFEKIYLHQSYVWYYYILLDFERCLQHAKEWTSIFNQDPNMKEKDPDLYMRGLHYALTAVYNLKKDEAFEKYLKEFEGFDADFSKSFNTISKTLSFLYIYTAKINKHYLEGSFDQGLALVPIILKQLRKHEKHLDVHRILVFYYKIAYLYYGSGDYEVALDYLNNITKLKAGHLREDIQCFSRLLEVICHYELGNYDLLPYLLNSVHRFLDKMEELNKMQVETIRFFKTISSLPINEYTDAFQKFKLILTKLEKDPFEKRAFLYLDMSTWVESKLMKKSLKSVIKKQFLTRR